MTCSSFRLTLGCQSSVHLAEDEAYPSSGLLVRYARVVAPVAGSGSGSDLCGGGRAVVAARWGMEYSYA